MERTVGTLKALVALTCILGSSVTLAQVSVLTQHNDNARTGLNANETTLTTSTVNVAMFGKLFARAVDGNIYAQPLYAPNLNIGGKTRNVIYIATAHNSVYAFDADDPNATQPLWHTGPSTLGTPVPNSDICAIYPPCPYTDVQPEIGIISTPVIDLANNAIYLVNRMKDSSGTNHFQLWALDLVSGGPKFNSPMEITDLGGQFVPFQQLQRPGLLLLNNVLYIAFGSMGDFGTNWHGWVFAYTASPTLAPVGTPLSVSPNGTGGGFWSGGTGLVADKSNIYGISSNGNFNGIGGQTTVPTQCSSCFLKLNSSLSEVDYYTPTAQSFLNPDNQDLGSGGLLLIPNTTLLIGGGKDGILRLVDSTGMGGYSAVSDTALQTFQVTPKDIMGGLAFWNNVLYLWGPGDSSTNTPDFLKAWTFDPGTERFVTSAAASQATIPSSPGEANMAALSVSANGTAPGSAIVWANAPAKGSGDAVLSAVPGTLYAFDATDLKHELWDTQQNPCRDTFGNYAKFNSPTVANGKVYLPTFSGQLVVYGLNPAGSGSSRGFVQVAAAVPQSPTNSVQVSYACAESEGDLNIVAVGWSDSLSTVTSVSDTQGNTYKLAAGPTTGQSLTQSIYYAITKAAGNNTVTVNFNQNVPFPDVRIAEYTGIDNVTPLDSGTGASGASGVTSDSGPLTTTFANDVIFGANTLSDVTLAPGTGFTSRIITQPNGDIAEDELVSSVGTYHATATIRTSGSPWVMQAAAFKAASSGDFTLTASGAQTVNAGSSASYTVTATPQNGFSGAVALACTVPANMGMNCTLTPSSITPSGAPATATLTVNTTAPSQARVVPLGNLSPLYVLWLPLPGMALAGIGLGSRRRRRLGIGLILFLILAPTLLLLGCGGGGSSSGGGGSPGTPAGSYNITVTASASGLPGHTQAVTLTVQ